MTVIVWTHLARQLSRRHASHGARELVKVPEDGERPEAAFNSIGGKEVEAGDVDRGVAPAICTRGIQYGSAVRLVRATVDSNRMDLRRVPSEGRDVVAESYDTRRP